MRYGSVCAGIEAATVAWHPLGWQAAWYSEIEPFPCAVLKHHYPAVPNYGDMTKYEEWPDEPVDLLVGGTPCQSFSVAGMRKGLDDPRGNLMLTFGAIARRYRPEWLVWENVPGVLSSNGGRDFGTFLGMLAELGYGFAYRVLDAQWFGVAQRRRRVFVVANARGWQRAAAVLFERHSLQGNPPPSRETRQGTAPNTSGGAENSSIGFTTSSLAKYREGVGTLQANGGDLGGGSETLIAKAFAQNQLGEVRTSTIAGTINTNSNASGRNTPMVTQPVAFHHNARASQLPTDARDTSISDALTVSQQAAVAKPVAQPVATDLYNGAIDGEATHSLRVGNGNAMGGVPSVMAAMQVRRLTPVECERLQGFPDNYTNIPWRKKDEAPDGPRYKALGNSMAVPVMAWIGRRIKQVSEL